MPSDSKTSAKPVTRSVAVAQEKTRLQRIQRLKKALAERLVDPVPAIDALMTELGEGALHEELWEQLHAAATRDSMEQGVAGAYAKCADGPRMKRLPREAQATMLMHAAGYFQTVMHDDANEVSFLWRVLEASADHDEAFTRLEKHLEKQLDGTGLLKLYAKVAATPPKPLEVLATQSINRLLLLSGKTPLSEEACRQLLALVPTNPRVLDALEKHCCASDRPALGCALIENALEDTNAPESLRVQWHHRLVELYMDDAASPESAIPHVEALLKRDPAHAKALHAAEKLLAIRAVASRAAAALREARRVRGY